MAQETVVVPDIGSDAAEVVEILVAPGDAVEIDQGLVVLESDKASMEIPATVAGTVIELLAAVGDELSEGAKVVTIETGEASTVDSENEPENASLKETAEVGSLASESAAESRTPATPSRADANEGAPAGTESAPIVVHVPDIGTDEPVDLIELSVAVGDQVQAGDPLVVLESDKASMEVPAPAAGRVLELRVTEGQQVREGDELLVLAGDIAANAKTAKSNASSSENGNGSNAGTDAYTQVGLKGTAQAPLSRGITQSAPQPAMRTAETVSSPKESQVYAGPAVRLLAREFGVTLERVRGTGPGGRILKEDLHAYVKGALQEPSVAQASAGIPAVPEVDFAAFGPVEVVERSRIDALTAANMQRSWLNAPHVTQFDDADITDLEAFRKSLAKEAEQRGTRLTPVPFLLKACAVALARHEKLNASLSEGGNSVTFKRYVHIGMAVDTPAGLLVPVLRDADQKSLWELAEEVLDLAGRAREKKLKPSEMQGASFTVSSLGAVGGRGFTPIVNVPEVAILGVGKSSTQPVWDGGAFQPRLLLPLALSYDHRVVNGGDGGRFLTEVVSLLSDIRHLLL